MTGDVDDVVVRLRRQREAEERAALVVYDRLAEHGRVRATAQADADAALTRAIDTVRDALERHLPVNLTECARRAGVTKQTLYARLPADLIRNRPTLTVVPVDPDRQEDER